MQMGLSLGGGHRRVVQDCGQREALSMGLDRLGTGEASVIG
ncbi:hypothetical protein [Paenibacillus sp. NPDC093718]